MAVKTAPSFNIKNIRYITSEDGKPKEVILSIADFKRIAETLDIVSDKELLDSINRARYGLRKGNKLLTHEQVFSGL